MEFLQYVLGLGIGFLIVAVVVMWRGNVNEKRSSVRRKQWAEQRDSQPVSEPQGFQRARSSFGHRIERLEFDPETGLTVAYLHDGQEKRFNTYAKTDRDEKTWRQI